MTARRRRLDPDELMRCSFCNKSPFDIRRLVAGPGAKICDDCVQVCVEILGGGTAAQAPPGSAKLLEWQGQVYCSICQTEVPDEDVVPVGDRGFLCRPCLAALRQVVARRARR